MQEMVDDLLSV